MTMNSLPARRLDLAEHSPKQMSAMLRLERSIDLPSPLRDLVTVRASQINGCAVGIEMH